MMKKIKTGYYRHYKGGIANVIDEAKNSETGEIYVAYYHKESETGSIILWVRPKQMFLESVKVNGKQAPRFEYINKEIEEIEKFLDK